MTRSQAQGLRRARERILAVLLEGGARKRTVLDGLVRDRAVLDSLLADGSVRVSPGTSKRGTTYEISRKAR